MNRRKLMVLGVAGLASTAWANSKVFTGRFSNLGLSGYDPVGYFVSDQPVEGSAKHQAGWAGVDYRFANQANQANRDAFWPTPSGICRLMGGSVPMRWPTVTPPVLILKLGRWSTAACI